jgi:hypothetical protein
MNKILTAIRLKLPGFTFSSYEVEMPYADVYAFTFYHAPQGITRIAVSDNGDVYVYDPQRGMAIGL